MEKSISREQFDQLLDKVQKAREAGVDLSLEEDLSVAAMNLISLEEHFFFTGEKTSQPEHFDLLSEIRKLRIEVMKQLIDRHEGETWCITKHLLAASMRLIEVGTKLQAKGEKDKAKAVFDQAYRTYSIFWGLRLKLVSVPDVKNAAVGEKPWSLQDIVTKLSNCCDE